MFTYQTPTYQVLVGHEKRAYSLHYWQIPYKVWEEFQIVGPATE